MTAINWYEFLVFNKHYPILTNDEVEEFKKCNGYYSTVKLQEKNIILKLVDKNVMFMRKKFDLSVLPKTKHIIDNMFFGFDITKEQIEFIDEVNYDSNTTDIFLSCWDDVIKYLVTQHLNLNIRRIKSSEYNKLGFFVKPKRELIFKSTNYFSHTLGYIHEVKEFRINNKNYRIFLYYKITRSDDYELNVMTISENDYKYNFIDENRLFLLSESYSSKDYYFFDLNCTKFNNEDKLIINMGIYKDIMNNIHSLIKNNKTDVITQQMMTFFTEYDNNNDEYDNIPSKLRPLIDKYIVILKTNNPIKINKVVITKTSVEIPDEFKLVFTEGNLDLIKPKMLYSIRELCIKDNFNLNEFFENILKKMQLYNIVKFRNNTIDYSILVNNVNVKITEDMGVTKINNVRCRKMDLLHILSRSICFNNTTDYTKYVKDVGYIGIQWIKTINNGLLMSVETEANEYFQEIHGKIGIPIRLSFLRDEDKRGTVYVVLGECKFVIKYKGEFMNTIINRYDNSHIKLGNLFKTFTETIEEFNEDKLMTVIEEGMKELVIIKKRGEELVQHTIKLTKAERTQIEIGSKTYEGYLLLGRVSNNKYFIDKDELYVFKFVDGQWNRRCVVDDYTKQRIFEDRLANRLINIYNEPLKITTLHNV